MSDELTRTLEALRASAGKDSADRFLQQYVEQLAEEKAKGKYWGDKTKVNERIQELQSLYSNFAEVHDFRPGQIVRWKPGLKNKRRPEYNEPVVVIEKLTEPAYDTSQGAGSAYYRERLDIILGFIDNDNEMIAFHFDSRRFEPLE
jgi:hypothetical protein